HWVAREDAARERLLNPFIDRLDEIRRNRASDDLVLEDVAGTRLAWIEMDLRVGVLAAPTALSHITTFAVGPARERLLVGHLRTADARLNVELAFETVDDDLKVQLAHAGNDDLARRRVGFHAHRRIFRHERGD